MLTNAGCTHTLTQCAVTPYGVNPSAIPDSAFLGDRKDDALEEEERQLTAVEQSREEVLQQCVPAEGTYSTRLQKQELEIKLLKARLQEEINKPIQLRDTLLMTSKKRGAPEPAAEETQARPKQKKRFHQTYHCLAASEMVAAADKDVLDAEEAAEWAEIYQHAREAAKEAEAKMAKEKKAEQAREKAEKAAERLRERAEQKEQARLAKLEQQRLAKEAAAAKAKERADMVIEKKRITRTGTRSKGSREGCSL